MTAADPFDVLRREHATLSAVLRSLLAMVHAGPGAQPARFFDVMRAMLFYIDEFPERLHHQSESNVLFPRLARLRPDLMEAIARLDHDHVDGEARVRELQHLLLAWELMGESREPAFRAALETYVAFYLAHMAAEESELLPAARKAFGPDDLRALAREIQPGRDPLAGGAAGDSYERLFSRIVLTAPAPIGVGEPLEGTAG